MKKRIVLCSDDYGQGLTISKGILDLVERDRLSAVSCLVTLPYWEEHAGWLVPHHKKISIGMHFNLTEGSPLSDVYRAAHGPHFFTLSALLKKAFMRQLDKHAIIAEFIAQLDRFVAATGFLPDFVDGHQHVHQFPAIRDAVIAVYEERLKQHHSYIRIVDHRVGFRNIKKMVIYLSGTQALKKLLVKHQIPHNESFSGVYDFAKAKHYPQYFKQFLFEIKNNGLIMCHPGREENDSPHELKDMIANARYHEHQYFLSDTFLADCVQSGVKLVTKFTS